MIFVIKHYLVVKKFLIFSEKHNLQYNNNSLHLSDSHVVNKQ